MRDDDKSPPAVALIVEPLSVSEHRIGPEQENGTWTVLVTAYYASDDEDDYSATHSVRIVPPEEAGPHCLLHFGEFPTESAAVALGTRIRDLLLEVHDDDLVYMIYGCVEKLFGYQVGELDT